MSGQRIINNIKKVLTEFDEGDEVDIADIGSAMERKDGKIRWSRCEIAGAMSKLTEFFVPTGEKNKWNLKTYIVHHNV